MTEGVVSLPLDKVRIGPRLRAVDRDYVALLAASMAETGQHAPIHVGPADEEGKHLLIAGAHRCAAAAEAGLPTLLALVFTGDAVQRRMLEIDENLMRRELTELDRAVFLAERQSLYLAIHPETGVGKAPKGKNDKIVALSLWSCPHQTGQAALVADCAAMNSRGERMRKPL